MYLVRSLLAHRSVLWFMFIVNLLGTIYGYIWYQEQLADTPTKFLIFVPDSPTASLFFTLVVAGFLLKRNWPLLEALAIVTLFKYGIWAVVMNLLVWKVTGVLDWIAWMLILSHAAMAVEGLLYAPFYRIKGWHLAIAAIWTLHNDVIDYIFHMLPRYSMLNEYIPEIGYFTFWLSILSIVITYFLCLRQNRSQYNLK